MVQVYSEHAQGGYAPKSNVQSQGHADERYVDDAPYLGAPTRHTHYEYEYDAPVYEDAVHHFDDDESVRPKLGKAQWGGAIVSLALIAGLGIWGYNLMVRDVSDVPIIRDMTGQARLVPENPGGQLASHQGLSVNSVTAERYAAAPADRLTLAPEVMALTDEDRPVGDTVVIATAYKPEPKAEIVDDPALTPVLASIAVQEPVMSDEPILNVPLTAEPTALDTAEIATLDPELSPKVDAGPFASWPKPIARPVRLASLAATRSTSSNASSSDAQLDSVAGDILAALNAQEPTSDAVTVPVGARLVQLGAYQSESVAREEWVRISAKFDALMQGKTRVIEKAQSGGRTFYRLRAHGFKDAADTNRFCAALTARNAGCVPALQR